MDSLDGVEDLADLSELNVQGNKISSLDSIKNHPFLSKINLSRNHITEVEDIECLSTLPLLRYLRLEHNPVEGHSEAYWNPITDFPRHHNSRYPPSFRLYCLYLVSKLTVLDGIAVTAEEKVAAQNAYNPPTEVSLSIQHMNHQKVQAKSYARIKAEDLLRAKRLRPVVLCGPTGVGKRYSLNHLINN